MLQCVAVCGSVLQCVAVCCSVLHSAHQKQGRNPLGLFACSFWLVCMLSLVGRSPNGEHVHHKVLQCVAVCCRVLEIHIMYLNV